MFGPFSGMLYDYNEHNIQLESQGKLPQIDVDTSLKGKSHYSLCDSFHLKSKKKGPWTSFRDLHNTNLVVNSSICEQANSDMSKDRYINYYFTYPQFVTLLYYNSNDDDYTVCGFPDTSYAV